MTETMTAWRVDRLSPTGLMGSPYSGDGGTAQPFGRVVAEPCDWHPDTPPPTPDCPRCGVFAAGSPEGLLSSVPDLFESTGVTWATIGGFSWTISRVRLENPTHTVEPNAPLPARDRARPSLFAHDRPGTWRGSAYTREAIFTTVNDAELIDAMADAYRCPVTYLGRRRVPADMRQLRAALGLPPPPCTECGGTYQHAEACDWHPSHECPTCGRRWLCIPDCPDRSTRNPHTVRSTTA